jgi:tripartite-type tricarboxylate transporter receptor subunit TctC
MQRRQFAKIAAATTVGPLIFPTLSFGDNYPSRPIRFILPSPTGGSADAMMRLLQDQMKNYLHQTVVAENRGGAGGAIGTAEVARAAPDGYTICFIWNGPLSLIPLQRPNSGYDPLKDFAPISLVGSAPAVIMAHPSMPDDVPGLIQYAKSQKKEIECGNGGLGTPGHMWAQMFAKRAGINLLHVPFVGTSGTIPALVAGDIKLVVSTTSSIYNELAKAGKLKIIGVASLDASPLVPGVAPISRTLPGFEAEAWYGVMAPARTPEAILDKLNGAVVAALANPEVQKKFIENAVNPFSTTRKQMADRIFKEYEMWRVLIQNGTVTST